VNRIQRKHYVRGGGLLAVTLAALAAFFALRPPDDPFAAAAVTDPPFEPLTYAIQAFLWWDGGENGFTLDWVKNMGFTHVKQTFAWEDVEPARGDWRFGPADNLLGQTEARGLQVIARLSDTPEWARGPQGTAVEAITDTPPADPADYGAYCGEIATRYRGRIAAYQIWNEPNLSREWGGHAPDAAGYTALLAACSAAIRAADPDAVLISAGLAPTGNTDERALRDDIYLQQMYDAGFQQYVDAVGVHAPGFDAPAVGPDDAEREGRQRWMSFRRVEDLRKIMVRNGDAARQMAILEVGYTTDQRNPDYQWFAVSEAEQAERVAAAYTYAGENWRPWVGLMSAIYMAKPTWTEVNEEFWWSFSVPRLDEGYIALRPVVESVARMPKYCGDVINPAIPPETPIGSEVANGCR
jgi:hypothetical protein